MFTLIFIILKITHSLFISWWFIVLTLVIDSSILSYRNKLSARISNLETEVDQLKDDTDSFFNGDDSFEEYEN